MENIKKYLPVFIFSMILMLPISLLAAIQPNDSNQSSKQKREGLLSKLRNEIKNEISDHAHIHAHMAVINASILSCCLIASESPTTRLIGAALSGVTFAGISKIVGFTQFAKYIAIATLGTFTLAGFSCHPEESIWGIWEIELREFIKEIARESDARTA